MTRTLEQEGQSYLSDKLVFKENLIHEVNKLKEKLKKKNSLDQTELVNKHNMYPRRLNNTHNLPNIYQTSIFHSQRGA